METAGHGFDIDAERACAADGTGDQAAPAGEAEGRRMRTAIEQHWLPMCALAKAQFSGITRHGTAERHAAQGVRGDECAAVGLVPVPVGALPFVRVEHCDELHALAAAELIRLRGPNLYSTRLHEISFETSLRPLNKVPPSQPEQPFSTGSP
jgi:hypothetical protein